MLGILCILKKKRINDSHDLQDAIHELKATNRLTLWCMGKAQCKNKRTLSDKTDLDFDSDTGTDGGRSKPKRKKLSHTEAEARCNELVEELRDKHGSTYCMVQYRLWAEMIIAKTHGSTDQVPSAPMFGGKRPRGRSEYSGELSHALAEMAQSICNGPVNL